jgi:murein DD-endopeptidase MepM/ murein hydrolase activator NlpD
MHVVVRRLITLLVGAGALFPPASTSRAQPCWRPPVPDAEIVDPFRSPTCPWCAGNRGLEFRVDAPVGVGAVASGSVTFAGRVAGVAYVVVELPSGWRLTYGRLASIEVATGDVVLAGRRLGVTSEAFYFGLRIGDTYVDPSPFLGTVVGRPRLVPTDATPRRAAPPARTVCDRPAPVRSGPR